MLGLYDWDYTRTIANSIAYAKATGTGRSAFATASVNLSPKLTGFTFTGTSASSLDYIDCTATGFPSTEKFVWVDCFTNSGVVVDSSAWCDINSAAEWIVFVDSSPSGVSSFTLKVNPPDYLKKAYTVAVPSSGRPTLNINHSDFYFGDLNADNVIDQGDIDLVQEAVGISQSDPRWATLDVSSTNPHPASYYDFNHDGAVTSADVAYVSVNSGRTGE